MENDLIKIENLNVTFDEKVVFRDFSLSLRKGSITCILGPSGSGKTTLLKALSGLLPTNISSVPCSYIFQEPRLLPNLTALAG